MFALSRVCKLVVSLKLQRFLVVALALALTLYILWKVDQIRFEYHEVHTSPLLDPGRSSTPSSFLLQPKCPCHNEVVLARYLKPIDSYNVTVIKLPTSTGSSEHAFENEYGINELDKLDLPVVRHYLISVNDFNSNIVTCGLYGVLRRGPNQSVISFSLYGRNPVYSHTLKEIVQQAKELYPNWTIRVYHDNTIDPSIICSHECMIASETNVNASTSQLYDNVEFCDTEKMPYSINKTWSASYMVQMSWRWLPIGDDFVDRFLSRDTDSCIIQREVDAVNEWLNESTIFHIMRDHPFHRPPILGGMWGYKTHLNRSQSKYLFNVITDPVVSKWYKFYPTYITRGQDQYLLERFFWPLALVNATVHDSFSCTEPTLQVMNRTSSPFPSRRSGLNCFVGQLGCCNLTSVSDHSGPFDDKTIFPYVCPIECRPKEHKYWRWC